jgi:hypothetical protein
MIALYGIDDQKTVLTYNGSPHAPDVQAAVTALVANSSGNLGTAAPLSVALVAGVAIGLVAVGYFFGKG